MGEDSNHTLTSTSAPPVMAGCQGVIEKKGSLIEHAPQFESTLHLKQQAGWVPEAKLNAMGAVLRAQREIAMADWEAQVQALKDDVWQQAADAPPTKEERKKQEKEEREQKQKEEQEAAVAQAEAADKAMTPVERQAAAEAQFIRQGQQEDAEEEKLMRYATASEAQLYALPADALTARTYALRRPSTPFGRA
eukprot:COSAG01_NODE_1771_length_9270_cov_5.316868_9_plen_193_part_00